MTQASNKRIGLIVGSETEWPEAFIAEIARRNLGIEAELIKLGGTLMDEVCHYDLIIDRMSHDVPYYRAFVKFAELQGVYIVSNPFQWSADDKFLGTALASRLGLTSPRTVVLPNKTIRKELAPSSFRNLKYPMDWQGIVDYVGVPAIFKDIHSGGRLPVFRVHDVEELIRQYDESGQRTMILQQLIDSDTHIHCFVVGDSEVLALQYSPQTDSYLPGVFAQDEAIDSYVRDGAARLTEAYGYDINMVEFVVKEGQAFVINSTNPAPVIDLKLMTEDQFGWLVTKIADLAVDRVQNSGPQPSPFSKSAG